MTGSTVCCSRRPWERILLVRQRNGLGTDTIIAAIRDGHIAASLSAVFLNVVPAWDRFMLRAAGGRPWAPSAHPEAIVARRRILIDKVAAEDRIQLVHVEDAGPPRVVSGQVTRHAPCVSAQQLQQDTLERADDALDMRLVRRRIGPGVGVYRPDSEQRLLDPLVPQARSIVVLDMSDADGVRRAA